MAEGGWYPYDIGRSSDGGASSDILCVATLGAVLLEAWCGKYSVFKGALGSYVTGWFGAALSELGEGR